MLSEINNQIGDDQIKKALVGLNKTLVTVERAVKTMETMLASKDAKLNGILSNVEGLSGELKTSGPKINSVLTNLQETTDELKRLQLETMIKEVKSTIANISKTIENINNGEGSLGKLAKNDDLYKNLDATVIKFKKLADDIEKYPLRYTGFTKGQRKKGDQQKLKAEGKVPN